MREEIIDITTANGPMETFICQPERGGSYPHVFFLMDAPGIRDELRDMARRFATVGYFVMPPNLYYRAGRDTRYGPDMLDRASTDHQRMRAVRTRMTIPMSVNRGSGGAPTTRRRHAPWPPSARRSRTPAREGARWREAATASRSGRAPRRSSRRTPEPGARHRPTRRRPVPGTTRRTAACSQSFDFFRRFIRAMAEQSARFAFLARTTVSGNECPHPT